MELIQIYFLTNFKTLNTSIRHDFLITIIMYLRHGEIFLDLQFHLVHQVCGIKYFQDIRKILIPYLDLKTNSKIF